MGAGQEGQLHAEVLLRWFSFHLWMDAGLRWLGVRSCLT
jgi:hypothetical protein